MELGRCRIVDLGNWASEKYVISTPARPEDLRGQEEDEAEGQRPGNAVRDEVREEQRQGDLDEDRDRDDRPAVELDPERVGVRRLRVHIHRDREAADSLAGEKILPSLLGTHTHGRN